jgi:hypothetical protein
LKHGVFTFLFFPVINTSKYAYVTMLTLDRVSVCSFVIG